MVFCIYFLILKRCSRNRVCEVVCQLIDFDGHEKVGVVFITNVGIQIIYFLLIVDNSINCLFLLLCFSLINDKRINIKNMLPWRQFSEKFSTFARAAIVFGRKEKGASFLYHTRHYCYWYHSTITNVLFTICTLFIIIEYENEIVKVRTFVLSCCGWWWWL